MKYVLIALALVAGTALADTTTSDASSGSASQAGSAAGAAVQIDSHAVNEGTKIPVGGAAAIFTSACMTGASGQGMSAGAAVASDSAQCASLRQAAAHEALGDKLTLLAQNAVSGDGSQALYNRANDEYSKMYLYIDKADVAVDVTHYPRVAGDTAAAVLPVGLLGWLITLI